MDQKLFFLINREWAGPGLDRLMVTLSSLDFWIPFLILLIVWVALRGGFKARALLVTIAVTVAVTDGVVVNVLKKSVNRPRPRQVEAARTVEFKKTRPRFLGIFHPLRVKTSKPETGEIEGRSFPSGHTANNFAVAAVLAVFYRRRGRLYLFAAAGVAYSRIYTGSHWPSDVFFSIFLGLATGLAVTFSMEAAWKKWGGKVAPALFWRYPSLLKTPLCASLHPASSPSVP